ncbi:centromere-associated protein E-like [Anneissia japonica]|uniref:centromere-associated protein E-like n=1 Tax=Anneissia japonica TaxID=1529436 RepID=UPI0014259B1B|nr:centromere-associated protein E-like [Anneissia japonica]
MAEAVDDLLGLPLDDLPKPLPRALPKPLPLGPVPMFGRAVLPNISKNKGNISAPSSFKTALPSIPKNKGIKSASTTPLNVAMPAVHKDVSSDEGIMPPVPDVMLCKESIGELGLAESKKSLCHIPESEERGKADYNDFGDFDLSLESPSAKDASLIVKDGTRVEKTATVTCLPQQNKLDPILISPLKEPPPPTNTIKEKEPSEKEEEQKSLLANEEIFLLKRKVQDLETDQTQMDLYIKKINVELGDMEDELGVLSNEKEELSKKADNYAQIIKEKNTTIKEKDGNILSLKDELKQQLGDIEHLKQENVGLLNEVASLVSALSEQKTATEELKHEKTNLKKLYNESEATNTQQKIAIDNIQTMMYGYIDEKTELKKQLEELKLREKESQAAGTIPDKDVAKMEQQIQELEAEKKCFKERLDNKDRMAANLEKEKQSQVTKMKNKIQELEAKNKSFQVLLDTKEELAEVQKEDRKRQVAEMEKKISDLEAKNTSFQDLLDAKENLAAELNEKERYVGEMETKLEAEIASCKQLLNTKDSMISDLQNQKDRKCQALNSTIDDLQEENVTLKISEADWQKKCQHLESLLKTEKNASDVNGAYNVKKIQDLECKVMELSRENHALLDEKLKSGVSMDKAKPSMESHMITDTNLHSDVQPPVELGQGALKRVKNGNGSAQKLEETMKMMFLKQTNQLTSLQHQLLETKKEVKDVKEHLHEGEGARKVVGGKKSQQLAHPELTAKVVFLELENGRLISKIADLQQADTKSTVHRLEQKNKFSREMDRLTEQNQKFCKEIDELTEKNKQLCMEKDQIMEQNNKFRKDAEENSAVLLDFENTIEKIKNQHQKEKNFIKEVNQEYKVRMQKMMVALKDDLHQIKTDIAAGKITVRHITELETDLIMSDKTIKTLKTDLSLKNCTYSQLRGEEATAGVVSWRQRNMALTRDLLTARKELEQLRKEKQDLQEELHKVDNKRMTIKKNMDLVNETRLKRLENSLKIKQLKKDLNGTRRQMRTSLSKLGCNNQDAMKTEQNFTNDIKIKLGAYKMDVKTLQGQLNQQNEIANKKGVIFTKDPSQGADDQSENQIQHTDDESTDDTNESL